MPALPRPRATRLNAPMVAAAVATLVCAIAYHGHGRSWTVPGLDRLERISVDARFRVRGGRAPDPRIVIVGVDDATRDQYPEVTQTRRGWAKLIDAIAAQHPKVIALDLFFDSQEIALRPELAAEVRDAYAALATAADPEAQRARVVLGDVVEEMRGDDVLAEAIARAGNVYLGVDFFLATRASQIPAEPPEEVPGTEGARYGESAAAGGPNQPAIAFAAVATHPTIGRGARGAGMVNVIRDDDGVTRRLPMVVQHGDRHYLPMGLAVALAELDAPHDASYLGGQDFVIAAGRRLPLGDHASAVLDFLGPGKTFPHVSGATLLDGTAPPDALTGKLAFVGYTLGVDKVATPYDQLSDGVELHATLADNVLHGELLRPAGRTRSLLAILLLGAALTALQLRRVRRRAWVPALGAAALALGWLLAAYLWFAQARVIVELIAPLVAVAIATVAASVTALATEGREKARLRAAFSQYVSATLVERILAQPGLAHLGGERKELTVLFADIRGFSRFAETLEPEDLAAFLNEYLTPMTEIVLASSGTLDKYIGDAVMAIWGAPVDLPDYAERGCAAAIEMQAQLVPLNARWKARGLPAIKIGVGLNTGAMAVGNMGSEARFDYTVLGDAVNLAARLEALTKEYEVDVLTGEGTAQAAAGKFRFRELDWVRVVGRGGTAAIYELLGAKTELDLAAWADALAAYRARDFDRAVERWGDLALRFPDDGPTRLMRARAEALRADPPAEDWDGVYAQRSK